MKLKGVRLVVTSLERLRQWIYDRLGWLSFGDDARLYLSIWLIVEIGKIIVLASILYIIWTVGYYYFN